jgi:hypothetical protein
MLCAQLVAWWWPRATKEAVASVRHNCTGIDRGDRAYQVGRQRQLQQYRPRNFCISGLNWVRLSLIQGRWRIGVFHSEHGTTVPGAPAICGMRGHQHGCAPHVAGIPRGFARGLHAITGHFGLGNDPTRRSWRARFATTRDCGAGLKIDTKAAIDRLNSFSAHSSRIAQSEVFETRDRPSASRRTPWREPAAARTSATPMDAAQVLREPGQRHVLQHFALSLLLLGPATFKVRSH